MCPSLSGVFVICYRVLFVGCMLGTPGPWGGVCVCLYFGVLVSSLCNGMQLSCIFEREIKTVLQFLLLTSPAIFTECKYM